MIKSLDLDEISTSTVNNRKYTMTRYSDNFHIVVHTLNAHYLDSFIRYNDWHRLQLTEQKINDCYPICLNIKIDGNDCTTVFWPMYTHT